MTTSFRARWRTREPTLTNAAAKGQDSLPVPYVALLRGINVGGNNKLPMAELRRVLHHCGFTDCATHLQSGNAVFTAPPTATTDLQETIKQAIHQMLDMSISVVVRSGTELMDAIKRNPFPQHIANGAKANRSKLFVTFLIDPPPVAFRNTVDSFDFAPDVVVVSGRELYLWCPDGIGRSPAGKFPWEKRIGGVATTRNWNTVTRLCELVSEFVRCQ